MSDITIIDDEQSYMEVSFDTHSIRIKTYNKYTYFDISRKSHIKSVKKLIKVLQRQLKIHEDK